jgi:hypothetical protein
VPGFSDALNAFDEAMEDVDNLVSIHRRRSGVGRRREETTLNRAMIVMTVAAWQAYVQDLLLNGVAALEPRRGEPRGQWVILRAAAFRARAAFATPNAENTRDLLLHVGYDPWPDWQWTIGHESLKSSDVRERMNRWLKVRHAVAHGHARLPEIPELGTSNGGPVLHLSHAERCIRFFRRVVARTDRGITGAFAGLG